MLYIAVQLKRVSESHIPLQETVLRSMARPPWFEHHCFKEDNSSKYYILLLKTKELGSSVI